MVNRTDPLSHLKVASPCSMRWEEMKGTDRKRFCEGCRLHVHNISEMTRGEANDLLRNSSGRLCVRYYKRQDGTILTRDCPIGAGECKKRYTKITVLWACIVLNCLGLASTSRNGGDTSRSFTHLPLVRWLQENLEPIVEQVQGANRSGATMGDVAAPTTGKVAAAVPPLDVKTKPKTTKTKPVADKTTKKKGGRHAKKH